MNKQLSLDQRVRNTQAMKVKILMLAKAGYNKSLPIIATIYEKAKQVYKTRYGKFGLIAIFIGINMMPIYLAKQFSEGSTLNNSLNNAHFTPTPTPTPFSTQGLSVNEPSEEFIKARSYNLDENLLMDLLNQERKKASLQPLETDDIEICIVAQSALSLIINLNRIPTNDELEKVDLGMLNKREVHFAHAIGFDDEAQVVEYFNKDETVRKIVTNRMFGKGCIKAQYGFAVLAATY